MHWVSENLFPQQCTLKSRYWNIPRLSISLSDYLTLTQWSRIRLVLSDSKRKWMNEWMTLFFYPTFTLDINWPVCSLCCVWCKCPSSSNCTQVALWCQHQASWNSISDTLSGMFFTLSVATADCVTRAAFCQKMKDMDALVFFLFRPVPVSLLASPFA